MPILTNYRLFLSHAWHRSEGYLRIIDFLNQSLYFKYINYSVPEDKAFVGLNDNELKQQIRRQIAPVNAVIILGGMYVSHSRWIQYEIDVAKEMNKPIIGIRPWNAERMPLAVTLAADVIVGWNTSSIVNAIKQYAK